MLFIYSNMKHFFSIVFALLGSLFLSCRSSQVQNLDPAHFSEELHKSKVQLLDVRTESEYLEGHIAGALLLDVKRSDFVDLAKKQLKPNCPVAVYCRSGKRSAMAASLLARAGFKVMNLDGGILRWLDEKYPVTK